MPFPLAELVAGDITRAAAYLAARREVVRTEGLPWAEKRANGLSDVLSGLGQSMTANPVLGKALLGGGLGALAGAGSHYLGGDEADPRAKRRGMLSSALTGGLAGAALGGGLGLVQHHLPGGDGHSSRPGPAGGTPGIGEFVHNGMRYRIDPETLRNNPELLGRAINASTGPNPVENLPGAALRFLWNNPVAPTSGKVLPVIGAIDAARSGMQRRVRDLQGGLTSLLGQAKDRPEQIGANRGAIERLAGNESAMHQMVHGPVPVSGNRLQRTGGHIRNAWRRLFGGEIHNDFTPGGNLHQTHEVTEYEVPRVRDPLTGHITEGIKPVTVTRQRPILDNAGHPVPQSVSRDLAREARHQGRNLRLGAKLNLPRFTRRMAFYGGIPLAEWAGRSYLGELGKAQDIREMLRQNARPIGPAQ